MTEYEQLPREQLEVGRWYVGRGRNGCIGLWNGDCFLVMARVGEKVGPGRYGWETKWGIKMEPYFEHDTGCFQPFRIVDMGQVTEPYGEPEYAAKMSFDA